MRGKINHFILAALCLSGSTFAYSPDNVIEVYNSCPAPTCCSNYIYLSGVYIGANVGRTSFEMDLHRPAALGLVPLNDGEVDTTNWSFIPVIGFDAYPCAKVPLRFELSYLYTDEKFNLNPLFDPDIAPGFFANDTFRVYNTMFTAYIDWRNCSRFIPFIGASYGWVSLKTRHFPSSLDDPNDIGTFRDSSHNNAWGGTIGTRVMLSCHIYGNIQFRYSSMKEIKFNNHLPTPVPLPNHDDYLSDYLHEKTLMLGIAYEF